ncbi:MAG: ABC transporter permease [candidate division KSB1 bacterium]|nr:ABC transporter permease [candidate division KSB1 bacterium]
MRWGIVYSIKEGLKGFRQARLSSLISISTITISLVIIGIFLIAIVNLTKFISSLKERVEFEVFIDNSLGDQKIEELKKTIASFVGVQTVEFISKEEAAKIFKETFGDDIFDILEENPLPASFRIKLAEAYRSPEGAKYISELIGQLEGVDEVVYRADLLRLLDKYIKLVMGLLLGVGGSVCIGSIFLVYNNIRLIIAARWDTIEIMKLVGATRGFIRRPFIIEGMLQGLLGAAGALALLYGITTLIINKFPGFIEVDARIFGGILIFGLLLGMLGSLVSVRRFLKY